MTHRNALLAIHLGALMFGLSGVFGKLAASTPLIITLGRAGFAVVALLLAAQMLPNKGTQPTARQRFGLLLGGLLALLLTRRSRSRTERRVRSVLDGLFMLPLGVSAVTLGFGFLITLDEPPLDLRDSPLLIPLAQALVALPLVVRTLVPVLSGVDDRLRQAAASLGAGPVRALVTVDLPVVWKPLLAAGGFAFAVSLGEFGATSFLARPDDPTLPVVIFRLIGRPGPLNDEMAMAASVVLAGTTALVMLLVERLRVPSVGAL